jgi:hypothetical protein
MAQLEETAGEDEEKYNDSTRVMREDGNVYRGIFPL